jgi:dihydrofolate reductase
MRKLIAVEFVSLDGVIQAPGHTGEDQEGGFEHGGWTRPFFEDHGRYNLETYQAAGAFLFGRVTYEIFAAYWPTVTDENNQIARALNSLPKYVVSARLNEAQWAGTTVIEGDVAAEVSTLKTQPGKSILVIGSSELAQTLMQHDLIDEYQLWVHPVVLGKGKRLFRDEGFTATLKLVNSRTTSHGLVILTYGADKTGIGPS